MLRVNGGHVTGRGKRGCPSKLTREVSETVVRALDSGLTMAAAATVAGIGERTLHRWVARPTETDERADLQALREAIERRRAAPIRAVSRGAHPPAGRRKAGRPGPTGPVKLTPEIGAAVVQALGLGLSLETAARFAGINRSTIHRWLARAEKADAPPELRQLRKRISAAQASRAVTLLEAVTGAVLEPTETIKTVERPGLMGEKIVETTVTRGPPNLKAAIWWLERRLPEFERRVGGDAMPMEQVLELVGWLAQRIRETADDGMQARLDALSLGRLNELPQRTRAVVVEAEIVR